LSSADFQDVFFQFLLTLTLSSGLDSHVRLCTLHGLVPLVGANEGVIVSLVEYLERQLFKERKQQKATLAKKKKKAAEKNFVLCMNL
jgi:hypothetical protein